MLRVTICLNYDLTCSSIGHRHCIVNMEKDELIDQIQKKYPGCSIEKYDADRTKVYIDITANLNVEIDIFENKIQEVDYILGAVDDLLKFGESKL